MVNDPVVDSVYVSPTMDASYQLVSVSDANCTAFAEGNFDLSVEQPKTAGPDQEVNLCADGQEVDFLDYLHPEAGSGAVFPGLSGGAATSDLSGTYLLVDIGQSCPSDTASYQFTFTEAGTASNVSVICGQPNPYEYVVAFEVAGGTPPFEADNGSFAGNAFTSLPISVLDQPETVIEVSDGSGCVFEVEAEVEDTNGNGVCDEGEIFGCMDPSASNYNPMATSPGLCTYNFMQPTDELTDGFTDGFGIAEYEGPNDEIGGAWEVTLFPNPIFSDQTVHVLFKSISADTSVRIDVMDLTGRLIQSQEVSVGRGDSRFSLEFDKSLSQGVYLINFLHQNKLKTQRLIVME